MLKYLFRLIGVLLLVIVLYGLLNFKLLKRVYHSITLFDESVIVQNFQNMADIVDVKVIEPSASPYQWAERKDYQLLERFSFKDSVFTVKDYFQNTRTEGFMVIHRDTIVFESYYNDLEPEETHISWSVAKSFVSTLIGILHDEGKFQLMDPITKYLPQRNPPHHVVESTTEIHSHDDWKINQFDWAVDVVRQA